MSFYVVNGTGYLPNKFATYELAKEHADVAYYEGEQYKIVEGEEAFRETWKNGMLESDHVVDWSSCIKDMENDKLWKRFCKNFNLCTWHPGEIL